VQGAAKLPDDPTGPPKICCGGNAVRVMKCTVTTERPESPPGLRKSLSPVRDLPRGFRAGDSMSRHPYLFLSYILCDALNMVLVVIQFFRSLGIPRSLYQKRSFV
jgi:hypothetical protein